MLSRSAPRAAFRDSIHTPTSSLDQPTRLRESCTRCGKHPLLSSRHMVVRLRPVSSLTCLALSIASGMARARSPMKSGGPYIPAWYFKVNTELWVRSTDRSRWHPTYSESPLKRQADHRPSFRACRLAPARSPASTSERYPILAVLHHCPDDGARCPAVHHGGGIVFV